MQKSVLMTREAGRVRIDRRLMTGALRGGAYIAAAYVLGCCRLFFGT